ncbi:hypothetical protein FI667_g3514, partial [Globisporangium splendens]
MLPSILTPALIAPEAASQRIRLLTALKKIEFVEVKSSTGHGGERVYVTETHEYSSSASRISAAVSVARPDTSVPSQFPDRTLQSNRSVARVERAYSSFDELRLNAFYSVRDAHYRAYCGFCQSIVDEVNSGRNKPGSVLKLLRSDRKVVQTLTTFLNALLEIVKCSGGTLECRGQDQVCFLLHEFLYKGSVYSTQL